MLRSSVSGTDFMYRYVAPIHTFSSIGAAYRFALKQAILLQEVPVWVNKMSRRGRIMLNLDGKVDG